MINFLKNIYEWSNLNEYIDRDPNIITYLLVLLFLFLFILLLIATVKRIIFNYKLKRENKEILKRSDKNWLKALNTERKI